MTTRVIRAGGDLSYAAQVLRDGELCVVPTETVYGLAADGTNAQAVALLYERKNRPEIKPVSLLVPSLSDAEPLVANMPPDAAKLAAKLMPGALTLVLPKSDAVPDIVTAGLDCVAVRVPNHDTTLELLRLCGIPLACPSANPSGKPSPRTFSAALSYFDGAVPAAIDGGDCAVGTESTILDMTAYPYRVLRRGGITKRAVANALGQKVEGLTLIGITGGTGSGKTTALRALSSLGALVLDCDAVYRELTETNVPMLAELNARFPGVAEGGALDRRKLAGIVFTDKSALSDLNAITHAYIDREIMGRIARFADSGGKVAAVDAIALVESGLSDRCDIVAAVTAPRAMRLQRIMRRDGLSEAAAELRINAQQPDEFYAQNCEIALRGDFEEESDFLSYCVRVFSSVLEDV